MSEDINFLPKEMRLDKKEKKTKDFEVRLSEPLRDGKNKNANKQDAEKSRQKKAWLGIFAFFKKNKPVKALGLNRKALEDERRNLLANIKNNKLGIAGQNSIQNKRPPMAKNRPVVSQKINDKEKEPFIAPFIAKILRFFKFTDKAYLKSKADKNSPDKHKPLFSAGGISPSSGAPSEALEVKNNMPMSGPALENSASKKSLEIKLDLLHSRQIKAGRLIRTNLIKGQELAFFNWNRAITVNALVLLGAFALMAGVWGYFVFSNERQKDYVSPKKYELAEKEAILGDLRKKVQEIGELREKSLIVKNMLDRHVYWTNFFNYLEENTLPGVYYEGFEGDLSGVYELNAKARDFKIFVAQQKLWQMENKHTEKYALASMEATSETDNAKDGLSKAKLIKFSMDLAVEKNIFYK